MRTLSAGTGRFFTEGADSAVNLIHDKMKHGFIHRLMCFLLLTALLSIGSRAGCQSGKPDDIGTVVNDALVFCVQQARGMAESLQSRPGLLPKSADRFGNLETCRSGWWTSGFFPGILWYVYAYSGDREMLTWALEYSGRVKDQQKTTDNHDVGFIINCSYGNAFRITKDSSFREVLHTAAGSLATRFRRTTGCIRSWDYAEWNRQWDYPVIIDNMMNLELLMVAAEEFGEPVFREIALSHARTTARYHYRPDFSCFHVVSYDTITGLPQSRHTSQGYSHSSSWARGQAWGLYGFTMMYRFTCDTAFLSLAEGIAGYLLHHPRMPDDKVPYWDFDAPNIPDCQRDASASAIICSALLELSRYVRPSLAEEYRSAAERQIRVLSSPLYRNAPGNNAHFILKHSVGHMPNNSEVDVPLIYADYYYVEALMRYRDLFLK